MFILQIYHQKDKPAGTAETQEQVIIGNSYSVFPIDQHVIDDERLHPEGSVYFVQYPDKQGDVVRRYIFDDEHAYILNENGSTFRTIYKPVKRAKSKSLVAEDKMITGSSRDNPLQLGNGVCNMEVMEKDQKNKESLNNPQFVIQFIELMNNSNMDEIERFYKIVSEKLNYLKNNDAELKTAFGISIENNGFEPV